MCEVLTCFDKTPYIQDAFKAYKPRTLFLYLNKAAKSQLKAIVEMHFPKMKTYAAGSA